MMAGDHTHHPRPAELESFLLGELPAYDAVRIVAHLLKGCEACGRQMEPLASVLFRPDLLADTPVEVGSQYDFPLFKAFAAARRYAAAFSRERRETERDREDLRLHEVPRPESLPAESRALRDWQRCEELLARLRDLRHSHPGTPVATAALAIGLTEQIPSEFRGAQALADLQARAWSERGNARRVADDLAGAEADLARALERARLGSGNLHLLARLLDLTASLRIDQRRFDDAFQLLDWVYAIHLELGERHEAGRALISKSSAAAYALDLQEAVRLLGQGLALIDPDRDPHLVLAVAHNLSYHLMDEGRLEEARRLLDESRVLCAAYGGRIDQLKLRWLDGRIAVRLDDLAGADRAFREVRVGFEELGLPYDIALVSLELAEVWLEQGRTEEIRLLLDDTLATFQARGICREALAALLMLRETAERQSITTALLRQVAAELQRLESGSAASRA
jgi:tetratricopeptide (TPR) repeat protein